MIKRKILAGACLAVFLIPFVQAGGEAHLPAWEVSKRSEPPVTKLYRLSPAGREAILVRYELNKFVSSQRTDYEKLKGIVKWASSRWAHDGDNDPKTSNPLKILELAAQGNNFRCVEDSETTVAAARSLRMPARVLSLRRSDIETATYGAGHVVAEVWLRDHKKWVFADSQFGIIPEEGGTPLNTVELIEALRRGSRTLQFVQADGKATNDYVNWLRPYLYYLEYRVDQDLENPNRSPDRILLAPNGAKVPSFFQKIPLEGRTFPVYSPKDFYLAPS